MQKEKNDRALALNEQIMSKREQRHLATIIANFISKALMVCFGPKSRKLVMEKTLSYVKVCDDLPDYILPAETTIAQQ